MRTDFEASTTRSKAKSEQTGQLSSLQSGGGGDITCESESVVAGDDLLQSSLCLRVLSPHETIVRFHVDAKLGIDPVDEWDPVCVLELDEGSGLIVVKAKWGSPCELGCGHRYDRLPDSIGVDKFDQRGYDFLTGL
jgi:hypothetical protein